MANYTSDEDVEIAYNAVQDSFKSGKTKELAWRKWQLKQIWWLVEDNEQLIQDALKQDMNRHAFETSFTECVVIKTDLIEHLKNFDKWTADQTPDAGLLGLLLKPIVRPEPLGVALIIGPWNFPISLVIQPMIAAITAGCSVILKPSEITTACQQLFVDLIPKYMDSSAIRVVTGGPAETSRLLERKYDHIFFTGSVNVARYVSVAAAKHLTPTVLELGGRCPAIVTQSADVEAAARDIAWMKFLNSGQICLSVNHVFAHPSVERKLVERMKFYFEGYGKGSPDGMAHIINDNNFQRLMGLWDKTEGTVECSGAPNAGTRAFPLAIVSNVKMTDSLLSQELFGPICPVIKASTQEAIDSINSLPRPLAIYVFSKDEKEIDQVISSTISGGVTVNGTLVHGMVPNAPLGGVGDSGHGAYHGEYGFKAFTHYRTIARPSSLFMKLISLTHPPYSVGNIKKLVVRNSVGIKRGWTLEKERESVQRARLVKKVLCGLKVFACAVVILGLADLTLQRRLGILRGL